MPGSSQSLKNTGSLVEVQHETMCDAAHRLARRRGAARPRCCAVRPSRGRRACTFSVFGLQTLTLRDLARLQEGIEIGPRHAARADHADHFAVRARKIFHAETGAAADAIVLQEAVVDHRHRRRVLGAEQKQQAEEGAGLAARICSRGCGRTRAASPPCRRACGRRPCRPSCCRRSSPPSGNRAPSSRPTARRRRCAPCRRRRRSPSPGTRRRARTWHSFMSSTLATSALLSMSIVERLLIPTVCDCRPREGGDPCAVSYRWSTTVVGFLAAVVMGPRLRGDDRGYAPF